MKKIEYLSDWNIVGKDAKTNDVFAMIEEDFSNNQDTPAKYVKNLWGKYKELPPGYKNNSMNGSIFEAIIITLLIKEGIRPIYIQVNLEFVPNIDFDIIVFPKNEHGVVDVSSPISFSLKTSLRERYKQADLEGIALKEVYKRAESYLITLDEDSEIEKFIKKIEDKDIRGIDRCINATSEEFDRLIQRLKDLNVDEAPAIRAVKKSKKI